MTRARDIANLVDANGDIVAGALDNVPAADVVNDTTPQLGGNLDTNGNDVNFGDGDNSYFGDGNDLQIYHSGSHSFVQSVGTGSLRLRNLTDDFDVLIESDDGSGGIATYIQADGSTGAVNLNHYGSNKLATTSTGIDVTGTVQGDTFTLDNGSSDWTFEVVSNNLIIKYAGTSKMKLDSSGNLTVVGDVTAFGTI